MESNLGDEASTVFCGYYTYLKIGAFSRSLSTDLCGADLRLTQPKVQHNTLKKPRDKSTKTDINS